VSAEFRVDGIPCLRNSVSTEFRVDGSPCRRNSVSTEFRFDGGIPCQRNSMETQGYIMLKKTLKSVFTINICFFSFLKCVSELADFRDF
jgi:hypothetical protein